MSRLCSCPRLLVGEVYPSVSVYYAGTWNDTSGYPLGTNAAYIEASYGDVATHLTRRAWYFGEGSTLNRDSSNNTVFEQFFKIYNPNGVAVPIKLTFHHFNKYTPGEPTLEGC